MQSLQDILDRGKNKAQQGKQRTVKPKPGKSVWRILTGWNKSEPHLFFHAYGQHFIKDANGKVKAVVGCQDKSFDMPCEVCAAINDAMRNCESDAMRNKIGESRSTQRFLMNAIDVDTDPTKVVILEVGSGLFNDILANIGEDHSIIDKDEGRDIVITRDGTGLNTRYSLAVRGKDKSISVPESAYMEMYDLHEYVNEDFEASQNKALAVLGIANKAPIAGSAASGLLTDSADADLDDEIPSFDDDAVTKQAEAELAEESEGQDAKDVTPDDEKAAAEDFGDDISEDDIEKLLADIG